MLTLFFLSIQADYKSTKTKIIKREKTMKKSSRVLYSLAAVLTLGWMLSGCSADLEETNTAVMAGISRSVSVESAKPVNASIEAPFGLVADTSTDNIVRIAWGCPAVPVNSWEIYLDGKLVAETDVLKQIEIESYSGEHTVAVAAVKDGRRSEAEGITVKVKGKAAPVANGLEDGAVYKIIAKCSGKTIDNDNWSTDIGTNIHQWSYGNDQANQQWRLVSAGNGLFWIQNLHSGHVLDAAAWGKTDGTNVLQWTKLNNENQYWQITEVESGWYKVINYYSGQALDVSAASADDGANIQTWTWNGSAAQLWSFTKVSENGVNKPQPVEPEAPVIQPETPSQPESGLNGSMSITEAQAVAAYAGLPYPKDNGYVAFTFENNTNGKYKNNEIFIVVLYQRNDGIYYWGRPDGTFKAVGANEYCDNYSYTIEDNAGTNGRRVFNIPKNTNGARIFYSYGSKLSIHGPENGVGVVFPSIANPSDPDYNKYYDWLEYTIRGDGVTWVNTTQVDQFGFPALITAYASNGSVRSNGDGLFTQTGVTASRDEVYAAYRNYMAQKGVSADFDCLAEQYRIVCPGKSSKFNKNYLDGYINEVWNYWTSHTTEVRHAQGKFILSGDGNNLKFYCTESYNPAMCRVGETYYVYGKPTTEQAFEGSGCLATDTKGNGMEPALQAWVCAALNRHVATRHDDPAWGYTSAPAPSNYNASYYQGGAANYYSGFWHSISTNNGLAYGFCYDDVHEQSSTTVVIDCQKIWIRLGF